VLDAAGAGKIWSASLRAARQAIDLSRFLGGEAKSHV